MIRKARRSDIPRIVEIRLGVRENRLGQSMLVVGQTVERLIDASMFWVCDENGTVSGFSAADPKDGSIFALFVDPESEGRGIGRHLLNVACDSLRSGAHTMATLATEPGTRAERLYRRDGWQEIGRQPDGQ